MKPSRDERLQRVRETFERSVEGDMLAIFFKLIAPPEDESYCYDTVCDGYGGPCACGDIEPVKVSRRSLERIARRTPRGPGVLEEAVIEWARARLALLEATNE